MANSSKKHDSASDRRESGQPGGGAGRRDEVGGSVCTRLPGLTRMTPTRRSAIRRRGARAIAALRATTTAERRRSSICRANCRKKRWGRATSRRARRGRSRGGSDLERRRGPGGQQPAGGGGHRERGRPQPPDPNREPGGDALYNEDTQGGVFYDKNTEIKRETEFHDATAAPIVDEKQKVTPENDQFRKMTLSRRGAESPED